MVLHLQYADDTLVFLEASFREVDTLKLFLHCFQKATRFKVNTLKSRMVGVGLTTAQVRDLVPGWDCQVEDLPTSYLGLPLVLGKPKKRHWSTITDKVDRRLAGWQGRFLTMAGRATLIQATLANSPIYLMSILHMPALVANRLNELMRNLLW
ncbi:uncharacterized protein LOC105420459 [Amborella trichopoda]|uniref:uncharacterized protein LOC105420459 n=1 Tax=Amborella trichopoda TaxID=13333 RepID=UPI0005D337E5|nr:uncharacterized protein LOC105420459 [Amborella trichopoda]|eukprot:XP_011622423.1 uncharacterized protein LOC105420459 [Amborella trichopoda]